MLRFSNVTKIYPRSGIALDDVHRPLETGLSNALADTLSFGGHVLQAGQQSAMCFHRLGEPNRGVAK